MRGATPSLHQYAFMMWYLVKRRDNFTFNFTFSSLVGVIISCFLPYLTTPYKIYKLHSVDWTLLYSSDTKITHG
jgi:hypothetical protein